jgi:hypothetical protein
MSELVIPDEVMSKHTTPEVLSRGENELIWNRIKDYLEPEGYFPVKKADFPDLSPEQWDFFYVRNPGPLHSIVEDQVFYTKDAMFQSATAEDLRNHIKVYLVERKLNEK